MITDPSLVTELNRATHHPQQLQAPELQHLTTGGQAPPRPADAKAAPVGTSRGSPVRPLPAGVPGALLALAALLVVSTGVLLLAFRSPGRRASAVQRIAAIRAAGCSALARRRSSHTIAAWCRVGLATLVSVAVAAGAVAVSRSAGTPHRPSSPPATSAATIARPVTPTTETYLTRTPDIMVWSVFVHIERDIVVLERAAAQEREHINELAGPNDGRDPSFGATRARDAVAGGAPLVSLVEAHRQTVSRYQAMVQQEYQFFVVAAKNPMMQVGLYEATATTPAATAVLRYDLDAVTTQLQQEQAIATAEDAAALQVSHQPPASAATPRITAPVGGVVSQGFGSTSLALEPTVTYHGVFYEHFHTGIDIANALDTPVGAAAPGRVILAGSSRDATGKLVGYGNYVVIDHGNGYVTLYGHLDQLVVTTDQLVLRGQEIGLLGSTGWSTGPHLHFEIRHDGEFLNPETLLGAAVRS